MAYLIILLVIAAVLAPVFYAMPSDRQKHQAALRAYAMRQGFHIKVCEIPQSRRDRVRKASVESGVAYRLAFQTIEPELKTRNIEPVILVREELLSEDDYSDVVYSGLEKQACFAPLRDTLLALPDSIAAIEYAPTGVGVYWLEQGDEALLDQLFTDLQSLLRQLLPLIKPEESS